MFAPKITLKNKNSLCCIFGLVTLTYVFSGNRSRFVGYSSNSLSRRQFNTSEINGTRSNEMESNLFKTGERDVPDVIIQYGIARTATTLQFQILCLMMAFLHEDEIQHVGCSHYKQGKKKYHVIKTHLISEILETNLSSDTWIFVTSNAAFPTYKKASLNRNIREIDAKHLRIPLIVDLNSVLKHGYLIVYEYQTIFGMSDEKMNQIVDYLRYWDILRICCGVQMSSQWREYLWENSNFTQYIKTSKTVCNLYTLFEVEKRLIKTYAYKKFASYIDAIGKLSVVDGRLDGKYCEQCNMNIARLHLKFNERCIESPE